MPTLKSVRAQIQKLQHEEQRLVQAAMAGSIAKVKKLMASLGVTLEHLGASVSQAAGKRAPGSVAAKKTRAPRAGVGAAKYQDPKTGATWSGFGRAPAWIADAKNRDDFLVGAVKAAPAKKAIKAAKAVKATSSKKAVKAAKPAAPAKKTRKPAAKKAAKKAAPAKKAVKAPRASKGGGASVQAGAEAATPAVAE